MRGEGVRDNREEEREARDIVKSKRNSRRREQSVGRKR